MGPKGDRESIFHSAENKKMSHKIRVQPMDVVRLELYLSKADQQLGVIGKESVFGVAVFGVREVTRQLTLELCGPIDDRRGWVLEQT